VEIVEQDGEATALLDKLDAPPRPIDRRLRIERAARHHPPHRRQSCPSAASLFRSVDARLRSGAAIELGRALGRLPPRTIVYAIEAESFAAGAPLSEPVAAATVDRRR